MSQASSQQSKKSGEGLCAICYDEEPNILFEPCNHGAICRTCLIGNIEHSKHDCKFCPVCKAEIKGVFLMEYEKQTNKHRVIGKIKFKI